MLDELSIRRSCGWKARSRSTGQRDSCRGLGPAREALGRGGPPASRSAGDARFAGPAHVDAGLQPALRLDQSGRTAGAGSHVALAGRTTGPATAARDDRGGTGRTGCTRGHGRATGRSPRPGRRCAGVHGSPQRSSPPHDPGKARPHCRSTRPARVRAAAARRAVRSLAGRSRPKSKPSGSPILSATTARTSLDEIRQGLGLVSETLFEVVRGVYRDLEASLERTFADFQGRVPSLLRFGTWIGGDRDGNPHVTPEVTSEAVRMHQESCWRTISSGSRNWAGG